jgi:hypothetical protein
MQKGLVERWTEVKCFVLVSKLQRSFGRGLCPCSSDQTDLLSSGDTEGRRGLHLVSAQHPHAFQIDICIVQPQRIYKSACLKRSTTCKPLVFLLPSILSFIWKQQCKVEM